MLAIRVWVALSGVLLLFAAPAQASEVPKEADAFTAFMAESYGKTLPEAKVRVIAPLRLDVAMPGGATVAYLDHIWRHCLQTPDDCDSALTEYLATNAANLRELNLPLQTANLRAVVRPVAAVEEMRNVGVADANMLPLAKLLVADLWIIGVKATPSGAVYLRVRDLAPLRLTPDEAFALAAKNLQAALQPLAGVAFGAARGGIHHRTGDFYESSRLMLHDVWASDARQLDFQLMVAVPMPNVVLFGNASSQSAISAMGMVAHNMLDRAPEPISATLLRWTPTGWEVLHP